MSSVPPDVQLIYTDNPGSLSATYGVATDISLESVVARIDGSGAAASFQPTLALYSQDGKLMARVPTSTIYSIGDTGVVTWSPFLSEEGTPFRNEVVGARVEKTAGHDQAVASVAAYTVTIVYDTVDFDSGGFWSAGNPSQLITPFTGIYTVSAHVQFAPSAAGNRFVRIIRDLNVVLAELQVPAAVGGIQWEETLTTTAHILNGANVEVIVGQDSGGALNTQTGDFSIVGFNTG